MSDARNKLTMALVKHGVFGEEAVAAEIDKIVDAIPTAVRGQYPEDKEEAALAYLETYYKAKEGVPAPTGETPATTGSEKAAPTAIPAADMRAINEFQNKSRVARADKAAKTHVKKVLADKPWPGSYMSPSLKMIPKADKAKFEEYRAKLVDDPENVKNYEACMKAIQNGEEMEVYIPSEDTWSPKTLGLIATTPAEGEGATNIVEKAMTLKQATAFLAFELCGYIPCDASTPGVKLGACKPSKKGKGSANGNAPVPRLVWVNRREALKKEDQHEYISKVKEVNGKPVTKEGTVRSKLSFIINVGKKQDGSPKTRRVRVSGKAVVPEFVRTSQKYEQLFGTASRQTNVITAPSEADRFKSDQILNETLYALSQRGSEYGDDAVAFQEKFSELVSKSAGNAASDIDLG